MADSAVPIRQRRALTHKWVRYGFLTWAMVSSLWLANSFRTQGVDAQTLRSSSKVTVNDRTETLEFTPVATTSRSALVFICGSGVAAQAYAPLLRPIAERGYTVAVVKLPYRFAPLEAHKRAAVERVKRVIAHHPEVSGWVLAGHSLGGALACRLIQEAPRKVLALALIGTTHPKEDDLSHLAIPVTKVFATHDGVAPLEKIIANRALLPSHTKWIEIEGGNHSQFGNYGHQLQDGRATISRAEQQEITRSALLKALAGTQEKAQPVRQLKLLPVSDSHRKA